MSKKFLISFAALKNQKAKVISFRAIGDSPNAVHLTNESNGSGSIFHQPEPLIVTVWLMPETPLSMRSFRHSSLRLTHRGRIKNTTRSSYSLISIFTFRNCSITSAFVRACALARVAVKPLAGAPSAMASAYGSNN
jgi:hypothetical protein